MFICFRYSLGTKSVPTCHSSMYATYQHTATCRIPQSDVAKIKIISESCKCFKRKRYLNVTFTSFKAYKRVESAPLLPQKEPYFGLNKPMLEIAATYRTDTPKQTTRQAAPIG